MKIVFSVLLSFFTLLAMGQTQTLKGRWTAQSILLRNREIPLEKKEKFILKKDSSYVRRYYQYKSKGDSAKLFSATFFSIKKATVVKDVHGKVLKAKRVREKGKYTVDKGSGIIMFTTKEHAYTMDYTLDNRTLFLEESTEGIGKSKENVYLLKLRKKR